MEYMTPNFTKDMVKTHKILIPNMAVTQFRLMQAALASEGYQTEVLGNCGSEVAQLGLKYVHNDTCYPALLVIGQFLDALNSGKYDLDHTALLITQTGGGCRASNYIKMCIRDSRYTANHGSSASQFFHILMQSLSLSTKNPSAAAVCVVQKGRAGRIFL